MFRTVAFTIVASALVLSVGPVDSLATTIYSNLMPGQGYLSSGFAFGVFPSTIGDLAAAFTTPGGTAYGVTEIDVPLLALPGDNSFTVALMTDTAGHPGSLISSWNLMNVPVDNFPAGTIQPSQMISGVTGITLTPNTQYWLAAFPGDNNARGVWGSVQPGSEPEAFSSDNGSTWSVLVLGGSVMGLQVLGNSVVGSVPEPGIVILLGVGLALLLVSQRRRLKS